MRFTAGGLDQYRSQQCARAYAPITGHVAGHGTRSPRPPEGMLMHGRTSLCPIITIDGAGFLGLVSSGSRACPLRVANRKVELNECMAQIN
jgi:hypothetical protein